MSIQRRYVFVLSVYLNTRGFSFVLFEGHLSPFDWGVKEIRGAPKRRRCLSGVRELLHRYMPDVLVIQDTTSTGTKRARRIIKLNDAIASVGRSLGIPVYAYSRDQTHRRFQHLGVEDKQGMAELIARHIPAFERYVPRPRKPWMSEDARMGLFDAAALALIFFQSMGDDK